MVEDFSHLISVGHCAKDMDALTLSEECERVSLDFGVLLHSAHNQLDL